MTLAARPMLWSAGHSHILERLHAPRLSLVPLAGLALLASTGLAFAKDSVTIGTVLEPPGLDPTSAPAAAIGQVTHYTIFEGLTKINEDFSVTPLLAELWTFSPDLKTLTFKLKPDVKFQDGEPFSSKDVKFSFERFGAKDFDQQGQGVLRLDRVDRNPRPADGRAPFQGAELSGAVSPRQRDRGHPRREERGERGDEPGRHRPLQALRHGPRARRLTLDKWDGYRDAAKVPLEHATFRFISDPSAEVAALLAGDIDVMAELAECPGARPVQERPALPGPGRRHRGQDDPRHEQQEEAARRSQGAAGDRLCDRPQGGHRRRDGRPRRADRQPPHPERSRLCRPHRHVSARPGEGEGAAQGGGRQLPLELSLILPPPAYARQGGQIIAAELADVGINAKIQEVEWAQWLSGVYKDKNYDLTIISHVEPLDIGIYANPDYYFQYDSQAFRDINAKIAAAPNLDALKAALGEAQKKIADDSVNVFLFQYPDVTVADAKLKGLWKNAPLSATDVAALSWQMSRAGTAKG